MAACLRRPLPLPKASFEGIPESGLHVLAPGTLDFVPLVEQNLAEAERIAIRPLEPFLAVIRNGSGKALAVLMVRHEFRGAAKSCPVSPF